MAVSPTQGGTGCLSFCLPECDLIHGQRSLEAWLRWMAAGR